MSRLDLRASPDGTLLSVRVTPRANSTSITGVTEGKLLVRLNAPPVDGAANKSLCELLAKQLKCPKGSVKIVKGERSREKTVRLSGLTESAIRRVLER